MSKHKVSSKINFIHPNYIKKKTELMRIRGYFKHSSFYIYRRNFTLDKSPIVGLKVSTYSLINNYDFFLKYNDYLLADSTLNKTKLEHLLTLNQSRSTSHKDSSKVNRYKKKLLRSTSIKDSQQKRFVVDTLPLVQSTFMKKNTNLLNIFNFKFLLKNKQTAFKNKQNTVSFKKSIKNSILKS